MPPSMGGDDGAVAEAITRLLQLQRRLTDREKSHAEEKQRLADRIRSMERDAATAAVQVEVEAPSAAATSQSKTSANGRSGSSQGSKTSSSVPAPLSQASSMFKGGFKTLRSGMGI